MANDCMAKKSYYNIHLSVVSLELRSTVHLLKKNQNQKSKLRAELSRRSYFLIVIVVIIVDNGQAAAV